MLYENNEKSSGVRLLPPSSNIAGFSPFFLSPSSVSSPRVARQSWDGAAVVDSTDRPAVLRALTLYGELSALA